MKVIHQSFTATSLRMLLRTVLLMAVFTGLAPSAKGQFDGGWRTISSIALQKQDRRMFDFTNRIIGREILLREKQTLSFDVELGIARSLIYRADFQLDLGLLYRHEFNTFSRIFDLGYFVDGNITPLIQLYVRRYQIHQLGVPLTLQLKAPDLGNAGFFYLSCQAAGTIHWAKGMRHNPSGGYLWQWDLAPYSFEVNPGLGFKANRWAATISYRAYHVRQIDPVIFFPAMFSPPQFEETPTGFETHNPFKLWFTVSRDLDNGWWRKEHWPKWRGK